MYAIQKENERRYVSFNHYVESAGGRNRYSSENRCDVVTEQGIANLYNRPIEERVEAMISIAHPNFREQLCKEAIEAGLLRE